MEATRFMNSHINCCWLVRRGWLNFGIAVSAVLVSGCASFKPNPTETEAFLGRALKAGDTNLTVAVAVPTPEEAARLFDRKLHRKDIQPVWVRIENQGHKTAYFLPRAMDAEYFSPLEVAYQYRSMWRPARNRALEAYFYTNTMPVKISPGATRSGFVFTHFDQGTKHVTVAVLGENGLERFSFAPRIPGMNTDWQATDWKALARSVETSECDETRLRTELEKLPRAVTDKAGQKEGDPLNLVLIANPEDLEAFSWSGWDETERITSGSAWRTLKSFLFGGRYRYSPVSTLYVFGRGQDIALQKARGSVHLRNHLRLWATPYRFAGKNVWIGQISRDIGVRFTSKNITTHKIDPDVDETRSYLIQDLALSQGLSRFGFVKGVEPAPMDSPRHNLTGDPYFTDGLRVVLELTTTPTDLSEVRFLNWENLPEEEAD